MKNLWKHLKNELNIFHIFWTMVITSKFNYRILFVKLIYKFSYREEIFSYDTRNVLSFSIANYIYYDLYDKKSINNEYYFFSKDFFPSNSVLTHNCYLSLSSKEPFINVSFVNRRDKIKFCCYYINNLYRLFWSIFLG